MNLQLTKPIVFIDLETTGINVSLDKIVETTDAQQNINARE